MPTQGRGREAGEVVWSWGQPRGQRAAGGSWREGLMLGTAIRSSVSTLLSPWEVRPRGGGIHLQHLVRKTFPEAVWSMALF